MCSQLFLYSWLLNWDVLFIEDKFLLLLLRLAGLLYLDVLFWCIFNVFCLKSIIVRAFIDVKFY